MNPTYPRPPRRWRRRVNRAELDQLRRDVVAESLMTDQLAEVLERRVTSLEELVFARWPRSIAVRRRLARDLRASVAGYGDVGPTSSRAGSRLSATGGSSRCRPRRASPGRPWPPMRRRRPTPR